MTSQTLAPQDALFKLATDHGFALTRETGTHRFVKKGSATFKLPKMEDANEFTRSAILRICDEVDQRNHRAHGSRKPLPLAVNYQGETWAVYTANAGQYNLQSLENGKRQWVDKTEVEVVDEDELRIREPQPDPVALARIAAANSNGNGAHADAEPEAPPPAANGSVPAPASRPFNLSELEELDPMRFWVVTTERQIENYNKRIEKIMEDLQPLLDRRDALQRALAAATEKAPAEGKVVKRFQLHGDAKPARAGGGTGKSKRFPSEVVERAKGLLRSQPSLSNGEIASRVGSGMTAGTISYYRNSMARAS